MKAILILGFVRWVPIAAAVVLLGLLVYGTVQQNFRQSLNDPQIQLVEDAQQAIHSGTQSNKVIPTGPRFDASQSLSPFIALFDESGNQLESNATIGGKPLHIPEGVLKSAYNWGENRVTWEPEKGTRIALVVRPLKIESGWFIASGRNMREVEAREANLTFQVICAWFVTLGITLFASILAVFIEKRFRV